MSDSDNDVIDTAAAVSDVVARARSPHGAAAAQSLSECLLRWCPCQAEGSPHTRWTRLEERQRHTPARHDTGGAMQQLRQTILRRLDAHRDAHPRAMHVRDRHFPRDEAKPHREEGAEG